MQLEHTNAVENQCCHNRSHDDKIVKSIKARQQAVVSRRYHQQERHQAKYLTDKSTGFSPSVIRWPFFQVNLGQPVLLELRMMEVVATTGAIRRAKLQSNRHHQQTNTYIWEIVQINSNIIN